MRKAESGVGGKMNGLSQGAALALVAGIALSMVGCSREEPPKPQGTVDISDVPSLSPIDTPAQTPLPPEAGEPDSDPPTPGAIDLSQLNERDCYEVWKNHYEEIGLGGNDPSDGSLIITHGGNPSYTGMCDTGYITPK